ncbi:MAG TPA: hypothetical protein VMW16_11050 [Sedimentisphaerales bacterium]|nr:hypothetical protein [Sedimentisphaerales bacterium]
MVKKSVKTRKAGRKRSSAPKAKAHKRSGSKRKVRKGTVVKAKATKKVAIKARAKHVAPKAKAWKRSTPKAKAWKRSTPKAKAWKRSSRKSWKTPVAARKSVKTVAQKSIATRHVAQKPAPVRKVASKPHATPHRNQFDFNAWLLPTLELEQYEPHVAEEIGVQDSIKGSTRYAWIGAGQCGGRIVKSFYDLGYKKVLAVNTTHHDLDLLEIARNQKFLMDIGEKGAGKEMERGRDAVQQYQQQILHATRQIFGTQVDHIMVCFGAGGGTGGGSATGLIEIAKRYARYIGLSNPDKKVGAIMTLPTVGEASSPTVAKNAHDVARELSQMAAKGKISPLIIVDNEKINKLYPGMTVKSFWPSINSTVAGLFDIFNRVSALSTRYTTFDPVDYHSIMEAGSCAIMGLTRVNKFSDKFAISEAVRSNLEKTLLASGFNLSTAKVAGCIVVGGKRLMAEVKGLQDNINYAFDVLSEITGKATIHRGIYEDDKNSLRVYTIIGGLNAPTKRLEELSSCVTVQSH